MVERPFNVLKQRQGLATDLTTSPPCSINGCFVSPRGRAGQQVLARIWEPLAPTCKALLRNDTAATFTLLVALVSATIVARAELTAALTLGMAASVDP